MAKILKNNVAYDITIQDAGVTIFQSQYLTIHPTQYPAFASSSSVLTAIGNGELVVNDGSNDLNISDGIDLIKGLQIKNPFFTKTTIFTSTASDNSINASNAPVKSFTLLVSTTGLVTSWSVILEGSLDDMNYSTIVTHTNLLKSGENIFSGVTETPCLYFRLRCNQLTLGLGTSITAIVLGMQ